MRTLAGGVWAPTVPDDVVEFLSLSWRDLIGPRPAWMARAACRGTPTSVFFPERGESGETAKLLCAGCPVRVECREHAAAAGEAGFWGGEGDRQRRRRPPAVPAA
ncbi:MAG TPA: WhiB family transcriptional regulator [Acidimicrobiales bacterium]|nr:WhiB family transcriptional regulator [Acidimicrobiales bacterium]